MGRPSVLRIYRSIADIAFCIGHCAWYVQLPIYCVGICVACAESSAVRRRKEKIIVIGICSGAGYFGAVRRVGEYAARVITCTIIGHGHGHAVILGTRDIMLAVIGIGVCAVTHGGLTYEVSTGVGIALLLCVR